MKRKALLAVALVLSLSSAMVGCGNSGSSGDSTASNSSEAGETSTASTTDSTATEEGSEAETEQQAVSYDTSLPTELTDNLFDYRMQVGDDVFVLPMTLLQLRSAGWDGKYPTMRLDDAEESIEAVGVGWEPWSMDFKKDSLLVTTHITNHTDTVAECLTDEGAARIDVEYIQAFAKLNDQPIVLPKGITSGVSTEEDVIAAYGEPTDIEKKKSDSGRLTGYVYYYYEGEKQDNIKDVDKYIWINITNGENDSTGTPFTVQGVGMQYRS